MIRVTFEVEPHSDQEGELTDHEAAVLWAEAVVNQPTNIVTVRSDYKVELVLS